MNAPYRAHLVPALTSAADMFEELAKASDVHPRALLHRQLRFLADVVRGWHHQADDGDDAILLRQTLAHVEASRDCAEVLVPLLACLADVDDEHDFETCTGCEQCDGPLPFVLSTSERPTLSPASIEGEALTNTCEGSVGTNLPPIGLGRT